MQMYLTGLMLRAVLAPSLSVLNDDQVKIRQAPMAAGSGYDINVN